MSEVRRGLDRFAVLSLLGCTALWGLNQVATKLAVQEIAPLLQAGLRSLGAAVLLWLWAWRQGIELGPWAGRRRAGLLAGALFAAEFGCIFVGLQFTSASRMAVFIYLAPFVVALGMPLVAPAERLRGGQLLGLGLAFAGVVWAFAEGFQQPALGPRQWWGDGLGVLAALLWGGTTLVIRASRLGSAPAEQTLMAQLAVSAPLLLAASLALGEPWPVQASATAWALLAFQVVIVTFASYLLWFWLVRHYLATRLAAFSLLTPVFGLLFGVLLLDEPLGARLLVALLAVAAGIWLVSRPAR